MIDTVLNTPLKPQTTLGQFDHNLKLSEGAIPSNRIYSWE